MAYIYVLGEKKLTYHETYQKVISNLGWVDKGGLWVYDALTKQFETYRLSRADYLTIREGLDGYFSVVHNYQGAKLEITIHHFSDITKQLCKSSFDNYKVECTGDLSYWKFVPKYYTGSLNINDNFNFHLFKIDSGLIQLEDDKINWYHNGDFDFMYQGLTGVTENESELIFTVQRDGSLYRFDLEKNEMIKRFPLAGNSGNPIPVIKNNNEIWVVDYDTLLRINLNNWEIIKSRKLQDAADRTAQFIGDFSFSAHNNLCIVARPFSGDVIGVNENLKVQYICKTGKQPLQAVLMNDTIIARDWQTGELINGKLKRKFFA